MAEMGGTMISEIAIYEFSFDFLDSFKE